MICNLFAIVISLLILTVLLLIYHVILLRLQHVSIVVNPSIVARTMLIGVFEPKDFERISPTPASSSTARTGPPAITPVPSEAGLIRISPAPKCPIT